MEEVQINGQTYISSKRASEISGYTQDYVGQLARDRKISATRIGRSWYIDESDLREHAGIESPACEDESERGDEPEDEQEEVGVPEENKTGRTIPLHTLHTHPEKSEKHDFLSTWGSVTYIADDTPTHLPLAQKYTPHNERIVPIQKKAEESRKRGQSHVQPRVHTASQYTSQPLYPSIGGVIPPQKVAEPAVQKSRLSENMKSPESDYIFIRYFIPITLTLTLIVVASGAHLPAEWSFAQDASTAFSSGAVSDEAQGAIIDYFGALFMQGVDLIGAFLRTLIGSFGVLFEMGIDFLKGLLPQ